MHTVPECHLEAFAITENRRTPGIWQWSRSGGQPVLIGIPDATVVKDIYAFTEDSGARNQAIEDGLAEIEGQYRSARAVLLEGAMPTLDQFLALMHFVAWQLVRTPRWFQVSRDSMSRATKAEIIALAKDKDRYYAAMRGEFNSDDECEEGRLSVLAGGWHVESDDFTGLSMAVGEVPDLRLCLTLMNWTAFSNEGACRLMTSDNPVVTWADRCKGLEVGVAFGDPTMQLFFPLTPCNGLMATHTPFSLATAKLGGPDPNYPGLDDWQPRFRHGVATELLIEKLNLVTAANSDRYVYCSERTDSVDRFLEQRFVNQPAPVRRHDRLPIGSAT